MVDNQGEYGTLIALIKSIGAIECEVNLDDALHEDLGITSLNFIELIVEIEECFGVTIPDEVIVSDDIKTVRDLANVVLSKHTPETS
jgi:acyl carrier protein